MGTASSKHILMKSELTGGPRALEALFFKSPAHSQGSQSAAAESLRATGGGYSPRISHELWLVEATARLLPCGKHKGSHGLSHSVAGPWPSQSQSPRGRRQGSLS